MFWYLLQWMRIKNLISFHRKLRSQEEQRECRVRESQGLFSNQENRRNKGTSLVRWKQWFTEREKQSLGCVCVCMFFSGPDNKFILANIRFKCHAACREGSRSFTSISLQLLLRSPAQGWIFCMCSNEDCVI